MENDSYNIDVTAEMNQNNQEILYYDIEKQNNIKVVVRGMNISKRITSLKHSNINKILLNNIEHEGLKDITTIQKHVVPILTNNYRNLLINTQDTLGDPASYVIPILNDLLNNSENLLDGENNYCNPYALILSPTEELGREIHETVNLYAKNTGIKIKDIYSHDGDNFLSNNPNTLTPFLEGRGIHICIATPNNLIRFMNKHSIVFLSLRYVVIEKIELMITSGLDSDIHRIMNFNKISWPSTRSTVMSFSSDLTKEMQVFINKYLQPNYVSVTIKKHLCDEIDQLVINVLHLPKSLSVLKLLLNNDVNYQRVIMVVKNKKNSNELRSLLEHQFSLNAISVKTNEQHREKIVTDFMDNKIKILIVTIAALKYLDMNMNAKLVVIYDLPKTITEYVHIVSHTRKLRNTNKVVSYYCQPIDNKLVPDLLNVLQSTNQCTPNFLLRACR